MKLISYLDYWKLVQLAHEEFKSSRYRVRLGLPEEEYPLYISRKSTPSCEMGVYVYPSLEPVRFSKIREAAEKLPPFVYLFFLAYNKEGEVVPTTAKSDWVDRTKHKLRYFN